MKLEKISEIEQILDELAISEEGNFTDITDRLLRAICSFLNISLIMNPVNSLFNDRISSKQKNFIAACMLRALCRKQEIFWSTQQVNFRIKVFSLFDELLLNIYKKIGIHADSKNHEKSSKLQDIEGELIKSFSNLSQSINNLEDCQKVKAKFMPLLFGEFANTFLVSNFVDESIRDKQRITSIFRLLEGYTQAVSVDIAIEFHEKIKREYEIFISDIEEQPSQLANICIGQVFKKIFEVIEEDFKSRDEIVPTQVNAKVLEKKYPLHIEDREVSIKVHVANEGVGKAFDVEICITYDENFLNATNPIINIGHLAPGENGDFTFEACTQKASETQEPEIIIGKVSWSNYSGERNEQEFVGELLLQSPYLDWQELGKRKPYSLEAVTHESELVGRSELIKQLYAKLVSDQIESSIIFGQKRVGKTSIAKTIQNKLKKQENYTAIYLSVGSLDKNSPEKFLSSLGEVIFDEIYYEPVFADYNLPELRF